MQHLTVSQPLYLLTPQIQMRFLGPAHWGISANGSGNRTPDDSWTTSVSSLGDWEIELVWWALAQVNPSDEGVIYTNGTMVYKSCHCEPF